MDRESLTRGVGDPSERPISFSPDLERQLADLSDALERPGTDLQAILAVLSDDLAGGIPSFLGLSLTVMVTHGGSVTLTTIREGQAATASLELPLGAMTPAPAGSTMRLFAAAPGVFAGLADDARSAYGLDGDVRVDQHLGAAGPDSLRADLAAAGDINQAIGVLYGQGHAAALGELRRYAADHGLTRHEAALAILGDLEAGPGANSSGGVDGAG